MPPDITGTRLRVVPHAAGVYLLQLESDDGLNRLSLELLRRVGECRDVFPGARRFVLTGNDSSFSVGADLNAISRLDAATAWDLARQGQHWLNRIATSPIPYVAAIGGYCLGGGLDLALACRARLCAEGVYLGHHGAKLGLVTGWGGTQRLPRLIGSARSLEHLLAAKGWSAELALQQGLVEAVVPRTRLLAASFALSLIADISE